MDYQNQRCDGCLIPFSPQDDIVVCPVCATPQHRHCYEENGKCVNEEKHATGFVWQPAGNVQPNETMQPHNAEKSSVPCPVCGHNNPEQAENCERCGAALHVSNRQRLQDAEDLFFDAPKDDGMDLDEQERKQLELLLSERARMAAPGMTKEQQQERVAGHPIKQVMTFISSNALRYLTKFRRLESGSRVTWNWAVFFLSPYWFFYRKLYKPGIIFLTLRLCLSLLLTPAANKALELYQSLQANAAAMTDGAINEAMQQIIAALAPVYAGLGAVLVLAVVSALIADRLYLRYVHRSLDEAKAQPGKDVFLLSFLKKSSVSPLWAIASYAALPLLQTIVMSFFN